MIQRLKMIWRILHDRQVVVITESYGKLCYNQDTRSIEDVCQMCCDTFDEAKEMLDKSKRMKQSKYIPGDWVKANGQECRVEEVFVNRLTKEFEYTLIYPNGNSSRIVIGEIEPVPLTSEILKRANINFDTYSCDKGITSNIKYVHELQHLLFGLILNS